MPFAGGGGHRVLMVRPYPPEPRGRPHDIGMDSFLIPRRITRLP